MKYRKCLVVAVSLCCALGLTTVWTKLDVSNKYPEVITLVKLYYEGVQQEKQVLFTLYKGKRQQSECLTQGAFESLVGRLDSSNDHSNILKAAEDVETHIYEPPPVYLKSEQVLSEQTKKHVFLSPYQTKWNLHARTIKERALYESKVPRTVHFVFVSETSFHFSMGLYLAIRAAFLRIAPDAIYFHTYQVPEESPYYRLSEPMISKVIIHRPVTEIYGNPVKVPEHVTDVIKLRALLKYGGIYIDGDVLPLKSFDTFIHHSKPMTLGTEVDYEIRNRIPAAVMIGQRNNPFLDRWIQGYKKFNDHLWSESSVKQPARLAKEYPDEVNVENRYSFYYPYFGKEGVDIYFNRNDMQAMLKNRSYVVHLWYHGNKQYLIPLTPSLIFSCDIGINEIMRPLLPNPFVSFFFTVTTKELTRFALELYKSLVGIAQQSFPLWEVLIDIHSIDMNAASTLAYKSGNARFDIPYYSCNLTALVGFRISSSTAMQTFTEDLGVKMRGSAFSKLRCGKLKLEQDISFSHPPVVNDDTESGTEPVFTPKHKPFQDAHEWIKPRGAWLVEVGLGEVLPPDFLHRAFEIMRVNDTVENIAVPYSGSDGKLVNKSVQFVFGRN